MALVIVSGALATKPFNGGNAWSRLSWVLGLKRLGFEVLFVEQLPPSACVDAAGGPAPFRDSLNVAYFRDVMERFGLGGSSSLIHEPDGQTEGLPLAELHRKALGAQMLLNISGHLTLPQIRDPIPCKVYYDDDPGYTQFWHAMGSDGARLEGHHFHFTLGALIGTPGNDIPTSGIRWRPTRPPVVLQDWPATPPASFSRFTTVASWRGAYSALQFSGKTYGLKAHEFRKYIDLPRRDDAVYEIALQIHSGDHRDRDALTARGWHLVDPVSVADTPDRFRQYVAGSGAEFSVAQGIYVETRSGWFSDRTVRYLASGKPALVQDTGFSRLLPVGEGLLAFRSPDEALEESKRLRRDYPAHCRAARRIAEEYFDSDRVLGAMLGEIGLNHG